MDYNCLLSNILNVLEKNKAVLLIVSCCSMRFFLELCTVETEL